MIVLVGGTGAGILKHITPEQYRKHCGQLVSWRDAVSPIRAIKRGVVWGMDNFAFTGFNADKFDASLVSYSGMPGCKFVVAPDVVGDAFQTSQQFDLWYERIKSLGYPIALAAQDGLENMSIDWRFIDAIFVGGTNQFKYSDFLPELLRECNARGKWTHMGRVNSKRRWNYCNLLDFDSCDGTTVNIAPKNILGAITTLNNMQYSYLIN